MLRKAYLIFIIFVSFLSPCIWAETSVATTPKLRVRIMHAVDKIEVSGIDLTRTFLASGTRRSFSGKKRITFNCRQLNLPKYLGKAPYLLSRIESNTGLTTVGDEKYLGNILISVGEDGKSCDVINEVDIESYISSLLAKEMNGSWPVEALKAQAIAARTYAVYRIRARQQAIARGEKALYDVENSEKHQVGGHFFDATELTVKAAKETRGQILLTEKGRLTETFFHAACGGQTLLPSQVWSSRVEGYQSVTCDYCQRSDKEKYEFIVTSTRFKMFLKWALKSDLDYNSFLLAPDRIHNDKFRVYLGEQVFILEKTLLRKFFGRFEIPSNNFSLSRSGEVIHVDGKGNGHGVGMCQLGALAMAKLGKDYRAIILHYYPNHRLKLIYR